MMISPLSHRGLGILQHLHALVYLDMSGNVSIRFFFPMEIYLLAKLDYLDLSSTSISRLSDELQNVKSLRYSLQRNSRMTEVPSQVSSSLGRLEILGATSYMDPPDIHSNSIIDGLVGLKGCLKGLWISAYSMSDLNKLTQMFCATSIRILYIQIQSTDQTSTTVCLLPPDSWSKLHVFPIHGWHVPYIEELEMGGEHLLSPMWLKFNFVYQLCMQ